MRKSVTLKNVEISKFKSNVALVHIFTKLFILKRCSFVYLATNVTFASLVLYMNKKNKTVTYC